MELDKGHLPRREDTDMSEKDEDLENIESEETQPRDATEEIPDLMDEIHESERLSRLIAFGEGR